MKRKLIGFSVAGALVASALAWVVFWRDQRTLVWIALGWLGLLALGALGLVSYALARRLAARRSGRFRELP